MSHSRIPVIPPFFPGILPYFTIVSCCPPVVEISLFLTFLAPPKKPAGHVVCLLHLLHTVCGTLAAASTDWKSFTQTAPTSRRRRRAVEE